MFIAIFLWSGLVAAAYFFGGFILGFLTPGAAWLQANPDIAVWVTPILGFAGTLGVSAAIIAWLAGVALIALFGIGRRRARLAFEDWRKQDDGGAVPPRWRRYEREAQRNRAQWGDDDGDDDRRRRRDDEDDDDDRRRRRRRRDDDDDDDD